MRTLFAFAALAVATTVTPAFAQANPDAARTQAARSGPCTDPWVKIALDETYGAGAWGPALCDIYLYNNGQWNSYADLLSYVRGVQAENARQGIRLMIENPVTRSVVALVNNQIQAVLPPGLGQNGIVQTIFSRAAGFLNVPGGFLSAVMTTPSRKPRARYGPKRYRLLADEEASSIRLFYGPNELSFPK